MLPMRCLGVLIVLVVATGIGAAPLLAQVQEQVDVSKLKKGDKIEVRVGLEWMPAEFVEQISPKMIRVKREPFTRPVATIVDLIRLPAQRAPAAAGPDSQENPFATPEERAAGRKPRTWTDRGGRFRVEATLLRVEGENVVLKRADNKEVSVPLARLSDTDRRYVESTEPPAATAAPSARAESFPKADKAAREPEVPLVEAHLGSADLVDLGVGEWIYQPDPAPKSPALRNVRLPLAKLAFAERPQQLLLLPGEKLAFVVTSSTHQGQKFGVQALDLDRGVVSGSGTFSTQAAPIAVSPDGKWILARSQGFGTGTSAELRLYRREGVKAKPEKAWIPYLHHGPAEKGMHGIHYPWNADVEWADFLGSDRVISLSHAGELAVWQIPDLKAVYQAEVDGGTQPAFSRGGKYFAVTSGGYVVILQATDGKPVGRLLAGGAGSHLIDFSSDGKKLALVSGGRRLRVWDLTTRKLERDFGIPGVGGAPRGASHELAWVADNYLLAGSDVIDVTHYSTVSTVGQNSLWLEYGGRVWFVGDALSGPVLSSLVVPPQEVREKWAKVPPEALLVIRPGVEVAVELQASDAHAAEIREKIVKSLTERGLKVVSQSDVKLVGTVAPGKIEKVDYRTIGGLPFRVDAVDVQQYVATLSYLVGGQTVWTAQIQTAAPHFVHREKDQTIADAAQASARLDSSALARIWIPVTVARPLDKDEIASSTRPAN